MRKPFFSSLVICRTLFMISRMGKLISLIHSWRVNYNGCQKAHVMQHRSEHAVDIVASCPRVRPPFDYQKKPLWITLLTLTEAKVPIRQNMSFEKSSLIFNTGFLLVFFFNALPSYFFITLLSNRSFVADHFPFQPFYKNNLPQLSHQIQNYCRITKCRISRARPLIAGTITLTA